MRAFFEARGFNIRAGLGDNIIAGLGGLGEGVIAGLDSSNIDGQTVAQAGGPCTAYNIQHGRGCDPHYYSVAGGPDLPTLLMLLGLGLSFSRPEVGVPLGLTGAVLETCAAFNPLCTAAKLTSVNAVITTDIYGDWYAGLQASFGKSAIPFGAFSVNAGTIATPDGHIPTRAEVQDHLKGFSVSGETIFTGGIAFSPRATNKVSYYTPSYTNIFSLNAQFNILLYSP